MALPLDLLLRLPPALRGQAITATLPRTTLQYLPRRSLSSTPSHLARPPKQQPKQSSKAPNTSARPSASPPNQSTPTTTLPTKPPPRPPLHHSILAHLRTHPTLLLYRAPSSISFILSSLLLGTLGAYATYAQTILAANEPARLDPLTGEQLPPRRVPWYVKSIGLVVGLFYAVLSARAYMAPLKMVKTVSLVAKEAGSSASPMGPAGPATPTAAREIILRFQMRHALPFLRRPGLVLETPLKGATLNKTVQSHEDVSYTSIPLSHSTTWSSSALETPNAYVGQNKGFLSNVSQDIRRIFWRDGIAYVRIPKEGKAGEEGGKEGNWKLDLTGCEMLEHGTVLEEAMKVDAGTYVDERELPWWKRMLVVGAGASRR